MKHSHIYSFLHLPHFKKFRSAANISLDDATSCYSKDTRPALQTPHSNTRMQPLIWKLATSRHYKFLKDIVTLDVSWEEKMPVAIWRGQLTGSRDFYDKRLGDMENCNNMPRCRVVYELDNSTLVDAKLTTTRNRLPNELNNVSLVVQKTPIKQLLRYKAIIMLEGNDVASGLKWALLSQSVVLMPVPKHTSWAMEELLVPYVHYVPLKDDLSDVEQQMQWVLDNEDTAWKISQRSTLWMEDLCYHPDAVKDDTLVKEELLRRYAKHFRIIEDETEEATGSTTEIKKKKTM
uniref:Glycosyl transferase CAP10 domain-containing protein n=1 Tax=Grammatophora oceanica TaxID=210454 RepID=A0A7S1YH12_9STRA|mmetsp:Transcript_48722/g.72756  ORF Transcript_48722/g.72756 Transcript_48722/m.72756 type:complete len:291 (+) Transcript_48722:1-873(+)